MGGRARKATFALHEEVLAGIDEAVARGAAPSKNAFVEQAVVRELREQRRRERQARWEAASRDPLFLRDLQDVQRDFDSADSETAGGID